MSETTSNNRWRILTEQRPLWTWLALLFLIVAYFLLLGGETWEYTRGLLRQAFAYWLGLFLARRKVPRAFRFHFSRKRLLYDLVQLLFLQAIYRNYLTYLAPDQRDIFLNPLLSTIPILLTFLYARYRHQFPRRLVPLVLYLLFLAPPLSLSVVGEVGLTISSLLAANLAAHFPRRFTARLPLILRVAFLLILAGLLAAPLLTVDTASSFYYWHQCAAFALVFFYSYSCVRKEWDLLRVIGIVVACGLPFAGWLAFQDLSGSVRKDLGGVNLNTVAIIYEIMFCLALVLIVRVRNIGARIFYSICAVMYLGLQLAMYSRTGYAALLGAALLTGLALALRFLKQPPALRTVLLSLAFVGGIAAAYYALLSMYTMDRSVEIRLVYWAMAFEGWQQSPLYMIFGTGDTGPTYALYRFPVPEVVPIIEDFMKRPWHMEQHPHSDYVAMLYGYGIIGTVGLLLIVFALHRLASRDRLTATGYLLYAAVMTQWLHGIGDGAIIHYFNAGPMWFCIAALFALYRKEMPNAQADPLRRPLTSKWAQLTRPIVFIISLLVALSFLAYTYSVVRTNAFVVTHIQEIVSAGFAKPLSAEARSDLERSVGRYEQLNRAIPILDRNLNREAEIRFLLAQNPQPNNPDPASLAQQRADFLAIEDALCRAIALNASPLYYTRLARMYSMTAPEVRPDSLCNQPADEFIAEAARRDPYDLSRARPWFLPLPLQR